MTNDYTQGEARISFPSGLSDLELRNDHTQNIRLADAGGKFPMPSLRVLASEAAVKPEKNPPGDIPDSQVFIVYHSPKNLSLKVPEGWARKDLADGVTFADKFGQITVLVRPGPTPSLASVREGDAVELEKTGRAVKISEIKDVSLPAGPAVRIIYTENSEANAVTGKQIRIESERFLIGHGGDVVSVTFSAPAGADNADQWKLMARLSGMEVTWRSSKPTISSGSSTLATRKCAPCGGRV